MFNAMAAGWQKVFQVVQKDYIRLSQFPTLRSLCSLSVKCLRNFKMKHSK